MRVPSIKANFGPGSSHEITFEPGTFDRRGGPAKSSGGSHIALDSGGAVAIGGFQLKRVFARLTGSIVERGDFGPLMGM